MKKTMQRPINSFDGKSQMQSACQTQVNLPKGNPLRILEPNRKRLTSLKAERVLRVSEENIKNVQIVFILPKIIDSIERFNIVFGQELYTILKEHDILRRKYNDNVNLLKEGKRLQEEYDEWLEMKERQGDLFSESSSETKSESGQQEDEFVVRVKGQNMETLHQNVATTAEELKYSIKNILRKFRLDPTATKTVLEHENNLSEINKDFVKSLQDLQSIVREKLLTTPVELEERKYYIGKVVQRQNKILKIKEKLQMDYGQQIKIKRDEEEKQKEVIAKLKEALLSLSEASNKECSKILTDASQKIKSDAKLSDGKQKTTTQQIIDTKKAYNEQLRQNYEDEREKRKRKFKLSTEVFNWIQKYDADMGMRQDEYDEVLIQRDHLRKDLDDLGRHFSVLEKEYLDILEERRLAEEKEEQRRLEFERKTAAATKLQAGWRGYSVRKQLKKKKDKKGKKGKGGKGGKGKKK